MYLFFDTETTGLPGDDRRPYEDVDNWPRLVQLAFLLTDADGNEINAACHIVKPDGFRIPREAANVHGIFTERALLDGIPLNDVLDEFSRMLELSERLVAHNLAYDDNVLSAEYYRRSRYSPLDTKIKHCTMRHPDVIKHCAILNHKGTGHKWPKLSEMHQKLFGVAFDGAHDAGVDMQATARCFFELKRRGVDSQVFVPRKKRIDQDLELVRLSSDFV